MLIHMFLNFTVIIIVFINTIKYLPSFLDIKFVPLLISAEIVISLIVIFILTVIQIYVVEIMFFLLQKIPFVRGLLSAGVTSGYRRYMAYDYKQS
jgi:hypothetical protein